MADLRSSIPQARVAHEAGRVIHDLGGNGRAVEGQRQPQPFSEPVVPLPPVKPIAEMERPQATARLGKAASDLEALCLEFTHEAQGELAVVVQFFRALAQRRQARQTASDLGRTEPPDHVDLARHPSLADIERLEKLTVDLQWVAGELQKLKKLPMELQGRINEIVKAVSPTEPPKAA